MSEESVIHIDVLRSAGPATHVLVIGVGRYDHLPGGGGMETPYAEGMKQLTSPPISARAFAGWFLSGKFDNPDRPLASIALVLSDPVSTTIRIDGRDAQVPQADARHVSDAILSWFDRCNANPENLAVLYFCGHGMASGSRMAIAMGDYGRYQANAYAGTIDLTALLTAMETCRASQQIFFIDACRVASGALMRTEAHLGEKPLMPDPVRRIDLGYAAAQQTYYATLPGDASYARPGKPSLFTEALLWGLGGAAADNGDGDWWTDTVRLLGAIDFFIGRSRRRGTERLQRPETGRQSAMRINRVEVDGDFATAYIGLDDHDAWKWAKLSYGSDAGPLETTTGVTLMQAGLPDWEVRLKAGNYKFEVTWVMDVPYSVHNITAWVVPPYKGIILKVRP
jgi:hypothetical protein